MPAILAGAGVGPPLARHRAEAKGVVKFTIASKPASQATTNPRNGSITGRSKSSVSASPLGSPAGFVAQAAFKSG
jgi:hypothetical protein